MIWSLSAPLLYVAVILMATAAMAAILGWAPEITAVMVVAWNVLAASCALRHYWILLGISLLGLWEVIFLVGEKQAALTARQGLPKRGLNHRGEAVARWLAAAWLAMREIGS
jgi:hypothetical protein